MSGSSNVFILLIAIVFWVVLLQRLLRAFREGIVLEMNDVSSGPNQDIDRSEEPFLYFVNVSFQVLLFIAITIFVPYFVYRVYFFPLD